MQKYFYPIFKLPTFYERDYIKQELPLWVKWWLLGKAGRKLSEILTGSEFTLLHTIQRKFKLLQINGRTEQEGEPTPENPVPIKNVTGNANIKIQNKNLFTGDYSQFNSTGGEGILYDYFKLPENDKVYTISVTAKNDFTPTGNTYLGFTANGGNGNSGANWVINGTSPIITKGTKITVKNIVKEKNFRYLSMYTKGATNLKKFTDNFEIQLEEGSTATSYVPHQEQNYPFSLKSKNLFDFDYILQHKNDFVQEGSYFLFLKLDDSFKKQFTVSTILKGSTQNLVMGFSTIINWTMSEEYRILNRGTIISPKSFDYSNAENVYFFIGTGNGISSDRHEINDIYNNYNIQVEKGSTATAYEPYYDIKAMEGTILQDDGIHQKREQYFLDGSENWQERINVNNVKEFYCHTNARFNSINNMKCNYANYYEYTFNYGNVGNFTYGINSKDFYICVPNELSLTDFKNKLAINNLIIEGNIEEEIIPYNSTQQAEYNAIKQAKSYDDITYITSESSELPPLLDIQYWKERGAEE